MRYRPRSSAAYRWGLWEAVGTATASVILLWLESVAIHLGFLGSVEGFLLRHRWPQLGIDVVRSRAQGFSVATQRLARAIPLENNCMVELVGVSNWECGVVRRRVGPILQTAPHQRNWSPGHSTRCHIVP